MKRNTLSSAIVLAVSLSPIAPVASAVEWGLGVGISGNEGRTIYVPIRLGNLRIEPEVRLSRSESEYTYLVSSVNNADYESKTISLGTGVYWHQSIGPSLESYMGGRIAYTKYDTSTTYPNNPANNYTTDESTFVIGPTLGAEYFFAKQFSVGLDMSLTFMKSSGDLDTAAGTQQSYDSTLIQTETRAALRFYF
jgi:hypothetical protein